MLFSIKMLLPKKVLSMVSHESDPDTVIKDEKYFDYCCSHYSVPLIIDVMFHLSSIII